MKACWRVTPSQVDCNARINGSKRNSYCLTTVAAILQAGARLSHRTLAVHCHTPPLVIPPFLKPQPLPPEYPGVKGSGHSIQQITIGESVLVTLEDRSLWRIRPADQQTVLGWSVGDSMWISSYGYSRYPNYPYVLDDKTQQTSASARYVPGP
jgi:hypothetical protein